MSPPEILTFGPFEFEPRTGMLLKHGHRIKLQPKPAVVLAKLLDEPGRLVTRAELQQALWPEGTHVDFELGIKTVVRKLRGALGDPAGASVYIQTAYGEGYRFLAPVSVRGPEAVPASIEESDPQPFSRGLPHPPAPTRRRWLWTGCLIAAGLTVATITLLLQAKERGADFQRRDWIVVAAFENPTGETLLNGSMEFALARELSRSAFVNVATPERVGDTLRLMRQDPEAPLTESLARQVALRDGEIKAIIAGRVPNDGSVSATVRNAIGGIAAAMHLCWHG